MKKLHFEITEQKVEEAMAYVILSGSIAAVQSTILLITHPFGADLQRRLILNSRICVPRAKQEAWREFKRTRSISCMMDKLVGK